jgi:hypothetical protein
MVPTHYISVTFLLRSYVPLARFILNLSSSSEVFLNVVFITMAVKVAGSEDDHLPPSSAEVKNE